MADSRRYLWQSGRWQRLLSLLNGVFWIVSAPALGIADEPSRQKPAKLLPSVTSDAPANVTINSDTLLPEPKNVQPLPAAPKSLRSWWILDDAGLSEMPEVAFQEPLGKAPGLLQ